MATITPISILNRIGTPGAPLFLSPAELAYNQPAESPTVDIADVLYIGNGVGVSVLVGASRQVELWGDQTIAGNKTFDISNLKITGGGPDYLVTTDGNGNLSFTNAPGGGLTQVATDATLTGQGTTASPLSVVAHAVAVAADGVTISGNGTTVSPLAVISHTVAVATDGVTITGNGTAADPLVVPPDTVSIATNATLTGTGTAANPLGVVPNSVSVATNATLAGNGTTASPLGVVADSVPVATDGTTITGNGTTASPLQAMNGTVAVAVDGVTIGGQGITASPLHVLPNSVAVAVNAPLTGNGTTATPLGLTTPLPLQYGGTGVNASSNATLLTALGAASAASLAGYLQLSGGTLTGALTLAGNATANLQPVSLQQMNAAIAAGVTSFNTRTGAITLAVADVTGAGGAPVANPTFTGTVTLAQNAASALQAVPLQQLTSTVSGYLPLGGGTLSGALTVSSGNLTVSTGNISGGNLIATAGNVIVGPQSSSSPMLTMASANVLTVQTQSGANLTTINHQANTSNFNGNVTIPAGVNGAFNFPSTGGTEGSLGNISGTQAGIIYTPGQSAMWRASDAAWFWGNAGIPMLLSAVGNLTISGTLTQGSDAALKDNIADSDLGLGHVLRLAPRCYNRKSAPERLEHGLIAQEVADILPTAIREHEQQWEGGDATATIWGIDYSQVIAALIGAVKELSAKVEALGGNTDIGT